MSTLPATMTAVLLTGHGGFDRLSVRDDVPVPLPRAGEVLLRVAAAGINNTDVNTRIGWYEKSVTEATERAAIEGFAEIPADSIRAAGASQTFPRIQGADACGLIVAVGAGVAQSRIGERVIVEPVFRPAATGLAEDLYFGAMWDGAFAEYTRVPAAHAHVVRTDLSAVELATFPCSGSAAQLMIDRSAVRAGNVVLVTGASGGVGTAAIQLAQSRGATVIAVADPAKAARVAELGAARVLPRGQDLVLALGRESIDVVIDVVGGPSFPALLDVLRPRGRYAAAGAIAGPIVALDLRSLYLKDLTLLGCTYFDPGTFANLVEAIETGAIKPVLAATFPLREIVRAQQAFIAKKHIGNIVLVP